MSREAIEERKGSVFWETHTREAVIWTEPKLEAGDLRAHLDFFFV